MGGTMNGYLPPCYIATRHLVEDEPSLRDYVAGVNSIRAADELARQSNAALRFLVNVTVRQKDEPSLHRTVLGESHNLPSNAYLNIIPQVHGPGACYRRAMFDPLFEPNALVISADLDQYVSGKLDSPDGIESLLHLVTEVWGRSALYGIGARSVPVALASHKVPSDTRIVHELFLSAAMHRAAEANGKHIELPEPHPDATPSYAALGECASGFYVINRGHEHYPTLSHAVQSLDQRAHLNHHAADYYTAVKAAQLGDVVQQYVSSGENLFYQPRSEPAEKLWAERLVMEQTAVLGHSDVRDVIRDVCADPMTVNRIAQYYPRQLVQHVGSLMLPVLKEEEQPRVTRMRARA